MLRFLISGYAFFSLIITYAYTFVATEEEIRDAEARDQLITGIFYPAALLGKTLRELLSKKK